MFHDITSLGDFVQEVMAAAGTFGGLTALGKLSVLITLLVSSLKVSPITRLVWSKLGWAQVLVAPVLGLAAGLIALGATGAPVTLPVLLGYLAAGGGAVFLHELLDGLKGAPGLGPVYLKAIDAIEGLLPGGSPTPTPANPVVSRAASAAQAAASSSAGHPTVHDMESPNARRL